MRIPRQLPLALCGLALLVPLAEGESLKNRSLNDVLVTPQRTVVVGGFQEDSGVIIDSVDARSWYAQPAPSGQGLWAICRGPDKFVAVGSKGVVVESRDGLSWKLVASLPGELWLFDVIHADGRYVAGGVNGLYMSVDGISWVRTDIDSNIYGLTHANGRYFAVGYEGKILSSSDGRTWTSHVSNTRFILRSIAYGNGVYIAVGGEGQHGMVMSTDGETWFPTSSGSKAQLMDIVFARGMFILVGGIWDRETQAWKAGTVEYSTDGKNWVTYFAHGHTLLDAIAPTADGWIVCGDDGYVGKVGVGGFGIQLEDLVAGERSILGEEASAEPGDEAYPLPTLRIEPGDPGTLVLRWPSAPGFTYRVRRSTDLRKWTDTGVSYTGTGEELRHVETLQTGEISVFFRLEIFR